MNAEAVPLTAAPLTAARKQKGRWAIGAVIALVVIVGIVAAIVLSQSKSSTTSTLSTATATKRAISVAVSGTGSSVAADSVTVNPQISGTVKKLYVSLGETVTAGDTLYTITSDSVQTSLLQAKASLLQAKQGVTQAESSYEQAESQLYDANTKVLQAKKALWKVQAEATTAPDHAYNLKMAKRSVTTAEESVDAAELGVTSADLGLQAAKASLTTSKGSYATALTNTKETVVTAPIDGVITALPLSVGTAVSSGTSSSSSSSGGTAAASSSSSSGSSTSSSSNSSGSSITITDMKSLQVELTVSEVDIPSVAVSQPATITFDAISGKTFTGSVSSILPNATTSSGVVNYTVYVKLNQLDERVRTGMTASVDIETQSAADAISVPNAAVKTDNGSKYVLVVDPSGQTTQKTVKVGLADDNYTQIVSGITEGTTVSTGSNSTASSTTSSSSTKSTNTRSLLGGTGGPPGGGPGGN
ncbi:MAG: efflux RND transporter periplasmic adaptor subunit [Coriobacteriia bacterium]|nr:efflux RND transporter periplasmic adaptor subunit [Coriobacteriia bacterium]